MRYVAAESDELEGETNEVIAEPNLPCEQPDDEGCDKFIVHSTIQRSGRHQNKSGTKLILV